MDCVQWELKDGAYSHYLPLEDAVKPEEIGAHGTKVILLGAKKLDEHDHSAGGCGIAVKVDIEVPQHPILPVPVSAND